MFLISNFIFTNKTPRYTLKKKNTINYKATSKVPTDWNSKSKTKATTFSQPYNSNQSPKTPKPVDLIPYPVQYKRTHKNTFAQFNTRKTKQGFVLNWWRVVFLILNFTSTSEQWNWAPVVEVRISRPGHLSNQKIYVHKQKNNSPKKIEIPKQKST